MLGYFAWKSSSTLSRIGASTAPALQPWRVRSPETLIGSKAVPLLAGALSAGDPLAWGAVLAPGVADPVLLPVLQPAAANNAARLRVIRVRRMPCSSAIGSRRAPSGRTTLRAGTPPRQLPPRYEGGVSLRVKRPF